MRRLRTLGVGAVAALAVFGGTFVASESAQAVGSLSPTSVATAPATAVPTTPPTAPATTTPTVTTPPADSTQSAAGTDPSLTTQDAAGNHAMGSTVAVHEPSSASPKSRSLLAVPNVSSSNVLGMDVSGWQPSVNWTTAWNQGARFAYVKATEGTTYKSSTFTQQYNGSAAVGMVRGAYHFATPNTSSGAAQASYFVANGGSWTGDGKTLPPLLDIEYGTNGAGTCWGLSQSAMVAWIHDFVNTVASKTGRQPAIYSTTDWWRTCTGNSAAFGANPLMVAIYGPALSSGPGTLGASWSTWSIWQYSSTGPFVGDSNVFKGTHADLVSFAANSSTPPPVDVKDSPVGYVDSLQAAPGGISVRGWAIDPNTTSAIQVHVYVDGAGYPLIANRSRPDVGAAYPAQGPNHGYEAVLNASAGNHKVCVYGINVGAGANQLLAPCVTVAVPGSSPIGRVEEVSVVSPTSIRVSGWALDGDVTNSISVAVYVDAAGRNVSANGLRPDIGQIYPGYGSAHGFSVILTVTRGSHQVCVYALNQGPPAPNPKLLCSNVVTDRAPIGSSDAITPGVGSVAIRGWALDLDTPTKSIRVDAYVGTAGKNLIANLSRPDVARAYSGVGALHGYSATLPAKKGNNQVCVYAIDSQGGTNTQLQCKVVAVK